MKKYTIITIITIGIILGFLTGIYIYKINQIKNKEIAQTNNYNKNNIESVNEANNENAIKTNSEEEKVSPNCTIILKVYYGKCNHIIEKKQTIEEAQVNMTEEEIKTKFSDWELQKFTPTEIVLYKEVDEFCNEHYVLREKDGYIAIFKIDENNNETLIEITDIPTEYLTEQDLENIQNGITIYGKKELNKAIEDFE